MQIVINIPEKVNNRLRSNLGHGYCLPNEDVKIIAEAIYNGQSVPHGVCMDCLMKNVCRFKIGLGDYGYCGQWKGAEYG